MKKKHILFFLIVFLLVGCKNEEETEKKEYLKIKSNIIKKENYTTSEELPADITIKMDRIDEEKIKYKVIISNPKENMRKIKAMVIHNYYTEDLFPSVGIFNEKKELLTQKKDDKLEITDNIKSIKNLSRLNLELKIWISYVNDKEETKEILYKTT